MVLPSIDFFQTRHYHFIDDARARVRPSSVLPRYCLRRLLMQALISAAFLLVIFGCARVYCAAAFARQQDMQRLLLQVRASVRRSAVDCSEAAKAARTSLSPPILFILFRCRFHDIYERDT